MKLEEGMYVRTKHGISKIGEDRRIEYGIFHPVVDILKEEVFIKVSHNIIDLIEVGDYVNGELVEYIEVDSYKDYVINSGYWCKQENIKSIVTKEQFESMSYKVEVEE